MPREVSRRSARSLRVSASRDPRVLGVDALGEVPQLVPPPATGNRDLAALDEQAQHHRDVAVVVPTAGGPRPHAGVRELLLRQRPVRAESLEDVQPALAVVLDPLRLVQLPVADLTPVRGHSAISARYIAMSSAARSDPRNSTRRSSLTASSRPAASSPTRAGSTAPGPRSVRSRWSGRAAPARVVVRSRPGLSVLLGQQLRADCDAAGIGATEPVHPGSCI